MNRILSGVLPIIHTPFDSSDHIDFGELGAEIDWLYQAGADGFGTGMVSEILRLTYDERKTLTETMVKLSGGRGAVFAAVGAESGKQALLYAKIAESAGCDAVMAAPPLSARLSSESTLNYYRTIANGIKIPVIVQDASSYVGSAISLDVYIRLMEEYGPDKILFKPEASPIGPNLSALRDATAGMARIFEGSGGFLLIDSFRRGIAGTMPGVDLLDGIVALWSALKRGDEESAYAIYYPICAIVVLELQAGLDGFLAIEKYLMVKRGLWKSDRRRQPYGWVLDHETAREVDRLYNQLQQVLAFMKTSSS